LSRVETEGRQAQKTPVMLNLFQHPWDQRPKKGSLEVSCAMDAETSSA
jgi:hypothetical protein